MATTLIRFQQRRNSRAAWTTGNEVLLQSEPGFETDTGRWKLGDGTTGWNSLPYQPIRDAGGIDARRYVKWDGVTDDTAGITAALTAAQNAGGGDVLFPAGVGCFSGVISVPSGVNILGMGNGKGAPATTFKATAAGAELRWGVAAGGVGNRGGVSGGFLVDGNNIARTPFHLLVCVQRTFESIDIVGAVTAGLLVEYAQNNLFSNIAVEDCVTGTGIVLDNGAGGNLFLRCESNANLVQVSVQQTGTDSGTVVGYAVPSHNKFVHGIFERPPAAGTVVVSHTAGTSNYFESCMLAATGSYGHPVTLLDVAYQGFNASGPVYVLGGQLQGQTADVTGIAVSDGATLTTRQSPYFLNLIVGIAVATGANVDIDNFRASTVLTRFTGNYDAYARFRFNVAMEHAVYGAIQLAHEIRDAVTNFPYYRLLGDGSLNWYPGTGFVPDARLYRSAAGTLTADAAFRPGRYATRPSAATVGAGAMIYDTTIEKPIWSNGTVWKDATGATV